MQETLINAEVLKLGDYKVPNNNWFKYWTQESAAELDVQAFPITNDLANLVEGHTHIPDKVTIGTISTPNQTAVLSPQHA